MANRNPLYLIESVYAGALPRAAGRSYLEAHGQQLPTVIYPEIRVLTADKPTLNMTYYAEAALRGDPERGTGLASFTYPYPIPIIRDHLSAPGAMGAPASEVYGRVRKPAQFLRSVQEGYVLAMPEITHPEAVEGILSGRWLTVSLGSRCQSVRCTICDQEMTEGGCDHVRGEEYEVDSVKKTAYWSIRDLKSKEISFVVTPSDDQAGVLSPNVTESAAAAQTPPRILVGNKRGVFDLATGAQVEESVYLSRTGRRVFSLNESRSPSSKESPMPDKKAALSADEIAVRNTKEAFKGEGRYLLMGGLHDHDAYLDKNGDGTSSWAYQSDPFGVFDRNNDATDYADHGDEGSHAHEIVGGVVLSGGDTVDNNHTHYMEPAHAGAEAAKDTDPVILGKLYRLPLDHPDYYKPDKDESLEEKALTAKDRNALPASAFCGPQRSFPGHDKGHVRDGLARLDHSKLSPSQKATVGNCLRRKGKSMGMTFTDKKEGEAGSTWNFAARLVDSEHQKEIQLYSLPTDLTTLEAVMAQFQAMPHTPAEKEAVLGRLAAHCRSFLETGEWQTRFGAVAVCEAGEPVNIALTNENYGLLYAAMDAGFTPGASDAATPADTTMETVAVDAVVETPPVTEAAPVTEERLLVPPIPAVVDPTVIGTAATAQAEVVERDLAGLDYEKQIARLKEAVLDANKIATEQEARSCQALAYSCALFMRVLQKPQARGGKAVEAMAAELAQRSSSSLTDKLADLCAEYDAGGGVAVSLPRLQDPTIPSADTSQGDHQGGRIATPEEAAALEQGVADLPPGIRITPLEELPLEEGDPVLFAHSPLLSNLFGIKGTPSLLAATSTD